MSKELSPLEKLHWLVDRAKETTTSKEVIDTFVEWGKDIETALKDYELIKQTKIIVVNKKISDEDLEKLKNQRIIIGGLEQCEIKPLYDEETQKKLKALEIIKEKGIILQFIKETYTVEQYNAGVFGTLVKPLTKEEYDLLKEVLS